MMTHSRGTCFLLIAWLGSVAQAEEAFAPRQDPLPVAPPAGAIVLFDGAGVNRFVSKDGGEIDWPVVDGALVSTHKGANVNHIVSQVYFRDADIHVEFMLPENGVGNSGIYIHGNYEAQILNSFGKDEPSQNDAGAIYGFAAPKVNACRKPLEWQVYDIRYHAPRRNDQGQIETEGSISAWLNGQQVQDNIRFGEPRSVYHPFRYGVTEYLRKIGEEQKKTSVGPLFLQDHGAPVRFRNVWIRPLDDRARDDTRANR